MKLKKAESSISDATTVTAVSGGAVIADRFKLDVPVETDAGKGTSSAATLVGAVAALTYVNWGEIQGL